MITAQEASMNIKQSVAGVKVIPVLVLDDEKVAVELAKVLVDLGLPVLEVTLRTLNALRVIEKMASVDGAVIAAGTVLSEVQVQQCQSAGASFLVSPGCTQKLEAAALQANMPLLPGVATASEVMQMADSGFDFLKFFPAAINGGVNALKALGGPLPHVSFCPTGGVNSNNFGDYLALKNVLCAGGSWLVTDQDVRERNWSEVQQKAQALTHMV